MSKQEQARNIQDWKREGPHCSNCVSFSSEIIEHDTPYGIYKKETMLRCNRGGFKTGKKCWCQFHQWKESK